VTTEASGFAAGGVAGFEFLLTPEVAIDLGARASFMTFGNVSAAGFTAANTETNGSSFGVHLGLQVFLGS